MMKMHTRVLSLLLVCTLCISMGAGMFQASTAVAAPVLAEGIVAATSGVTPIYLDQSYTFDERAADLVARMTLEEKASQMINGWSPAIPRLGLRWYNWWGEALHGVARWGNMSANMETIYNTTSYPINLSMASTFDPDLMYDVATEIGAEARETMPDNDRMLVYWSPTVNLNRDPRWGRSDESFGEDTYLTAKMAAEFVKGMEGKDHESGEPLDSKGYKKTITTLKHYLANNSEQNRLNGSSNITEQELREYYSYQYRLIIKDADVSSLMVGYNRVNEIPANLYHYITDTLLRQTFGFSGYIVSDCDSVWVAWGGNGVDLTDPKTSGPTAPMGHGWRLPDKYVTDGSEKETVNGEQVNRKISQKETVAWAITAGGDLECAGAFNGGMAGGGTQIFNYNLTIPGAVEEKIKTPTGLFDENSVDISIHRLMSARMQLGEFDSKTGNVSWYNKARDTIENDYGADWVYESKADNGAVTMTDDRVDLALEAAEKAIVLLKNDTMQNGKKLLPIDPTKYNKVAVIGYPANPTRSASNYMWLGGYSVNMGVGAYGKLVNGYEGIKAAFAAANPGATVAYYKGFTDAGTQVMLLQNVDKVAIDAAKNADLCIVYVASDSNSANEQNDNTAGIRLPGKQEDLINQVAAVNKNVVVYAEDITMVDTSAFEKNIPAMLWSCFNGQQKGTALANVLTGKVNPGARTPMIWYKSEASLIGENLITNTTTGAVRNWGARSYRLTPGRDEPYGYTHGRTYMYYDEARGGKLRYPFGYGLSYTEFTYDNFKVDGPTGGSIDANGTLTVSVDVKNAGPVAGSEVVQLYIAPPSDAPASLNLPIKRLLGFKRVYLEKDAEETVKLEVAVPDLAYFDVNQMKFVVYNGVYDVQISRSSADADIVDNETVEVTGTITPKISVVTAKPNQDGDNALDIPQRIIFDEGKTVDPQLTVAMSDDTLYGYVIKDKEFVFTDSVNGDRQDRTAPIPVDFVITYETNRDSVVEVAADGTITTVAPGVATITATVEDTATGSSDSCEFVVYVRQDPAKMPYITDLKLNNAVVTEFDRNREDYTYYVPLNASPEQYKYTAIGGTDCTMTITNLNSIPGTATITVSNDYATRTYNLNYIHVPAPEITRYSSVNGQLAWTAVGATRYDVYMSFNEPGERGIKLNSTDVTAFTFNIPATSRPVAEGMYYFTVVPFRGDMEGTPSKKFAYNLTGNIGEKPFISSITIGGVQVGDFSSDVINYFFTVPSGASPASYYYDSASPGNPAWTTSITNMTAIPGVARITVTGTSNTNTTTYSFYYNMCPAPQDLSAKVTGFNVNLTWPAIEGVSEYKVYRSTVSGTEGTEIASGLTSPSYRVADLAEGTYYFTVKAIAGGFTSAASNQVTAVVVATVIDKDALQSIVDMVLGMTLDSQDYTAETWAALQGALAAAQDVLNNPDASQAEVNTALANLFNTTIGLKTADPEAVNKIVLDAYIGLAESFSSGEYPAQNWASLQAALDAAKAVSENAEATQAMVEQAKNALGNAIAVLLQISGSGTQGSTTSGGGNSGGSTKTDGDVTRSSTGGSAPVVSPSKPVDVNEAAAVEQAQKAASGDGTVRFRNAGAITSNTMKAMANAGAKKVNADSMNSAGSAVEVRISFNPANGTKDINLYGSATSDIAKARKTLFEKWFSNKVQVVSFDQKGSFGMTVDIAVKVDLSGMDTEKLYFYSYDSDTKTYTRIETDYWIDGNGYVHFSTELAGDIVISEGPLTLK